MTVTLERIFDLLKIVFTGKILKEVNEIRYKKKKLNNLPQNNDINHGDLLVSIIIPTKNESLFLKDCLRSIFSSNYRPIEVVVVDYRSTDNTIEIAKHFGVKVIEVDESGVGYASHIGVINSLGDIIIRTDADSFFISELINNTVNYFVLNKEIMLKHIGHYYYDGGFMANFFSHLYDKYWRDIWKTTGYFIAFRRDIYEGVGGFDPLKKVGEDFDFGKKVFNMHPIGYDPKELIFISSRRIQATGFLKYLFGLRER
jgi:glycosyltransferase involved in cell wall biosynthesis